MATSLSRLSLLVVILLSLSLSGCVFSSEPVRHLASDVCLITPDLTQKQVLDILGPPNSQKKSADEGETWIYYEVKKSLLRKTPYIGDRLGNEDYEVITISFVGNQVRTCAYRALKEEEFKALGIPAQ
ncbi:MAG: hypothetical protein ACOY8P_02275 [Thermodesulfobacteriota bacterium]